MKKKLFNVVVYGLLAFAIVNASYLALPPELQAMIPQYNDLVAIVMGGSTALMSFGGLKVQEYLNSAKTESSEKFNVLAENYLALEKKYNVIENSYKIMKAAQDLTTKAVERNNQLLEVDLQAKLSNPMIDEEVKKLIESVIDNE